MAHHPDKPKEFYQQQNTAVLWGGGGRDDAVLIAIELPTFRRSVFKKYSR